MSEYDFSEMDLTGVEEWTLDDVRARVAVLEERIAAEHGFRGRAAIVQALEFCQLDETSGVQEWLSLTSLLAEESNDA